METNKTHIETNRNYIEMNKSANYITNNGWIVNTETGECVGSDYVSLYPRSYNDKKALISHSITRPKAFTFKDSYISSGYITDKKEKFISRMLNIVTCKLGELNAPFNINIFYQNCGRYYKYNQTNILYFPKVCAYSYIMLFCGISVKNIPKKYYKNVCSLNKEFPEYKEYMLRRNNSINYFSKHYKQFVEWCKRKGVNTNPLYYDILYTVYTQKISIPKATAFVDKGYYPIKNNCIHVEIRNLIRKLKK